MTKNPNCLTINMLITQLCALAAQSPLGEQTVVAVCDRDVPYREVYKTTLGVDGDGAVALVFAKA